MPKDGKIEISSKLHVLTNVSGQKKRTLRVDASENRINIGEAAGGYNNTLVNLYGDISSNGFHLKGETGDISANDASFNDLSANHVFVLSSNGLFVNNEDVMDKIDQQTQQILINAGDITDISGSFFVSPPTSVSTKLVWLVVRLGWQPFFLLEFVPFAV